MAKQDLPYNLMTADELLAAIDNHLNNKTIPFPPAYINDPPQDVEGLIVGVCVFCGGSLGGPYQEDLYHWECEKSKRTEERQ